MDNGRKRLIKSSVAASIALLIGHAEKAWKQSNIKRSMQYTEMIMKLVKRNKVRLNKNQKNRFCRKCLVWWDVPNSLKLVFDNRHNMFRAICQCGYSKRL
jgi:RNase P subunit RPR2